MAAKKKKAAAAEATASKKGGPNQAAVALRAKNATELNDELLKLRKEQFALRLQRATGQAVKPDQFGSVFERLRANNAGWMYFTDKAASAPFSGTPSFWQNEASEVGALPATVARRMSRGCDWS